MTQYGNVTANPTTTGRRIGARILIFVVNMIPLLFVLPATLTGRSPGMIQLVLMLVLGLAVGVVQLVLILKHSTHIGAWAFGVRFLDPRTGRGAGGTLLLKYILEYFLESATLGIITISYLVSHREGQHWLDRAMHVVAVDRASVQERQAGFSAPQGALRPAVPAGGVLPVQLPPRTPQGAPVQGFAPAPGFPAQAAPRPQQPVQFPPASPAPAFPPATPPAPTFQTPNFQTPSSQSTGAMTPPAPVAAPAPATPSASNPWALPTGAAPSTPAAPAAPVAASFTPPGQAEISRPAPAQSAVSVPSSMQNDETVLDADLDDLSASVVLDDGQVLTLETPVVLGRNPVAPDSYPAARSVQIVDDSMRLSKTHLAVLAVDGRVHVVDLGATNGIHLETDGVKARLEKGIEHPLAEGSVLHFGGRSLRLAP